MSATACLKLRMTSRWKRQRLWADSTLVLCWRRCGRNRRRHQRTMLAHADQVPADDPGTEPEEMLLEGDGPHVLAWRDWTDPAEVVTQSGAVLNPTAFWMRIGCSARGISEPLSRRRASVHSSPPVLWLPWTSIPASDTSLAAGTKANFACAKAVGACLTACARVGRANHPGSGTDAEKRSPRVRIIALRAAFKADSD